MISRTSAKCRGSNFIYWSHHLPHENILLVTGVCCQLFWCIEFFIWPSQTAFKHQQQQQQLRNKKCKSTGKLQNNFLFHWRIFISFHGLLLHLLKKIITLNFMTKSLCREFYEEVIWGASGLKLHFPWIIHCKGNQKS